MKTINQAMRMFVLLLVIGAGSTGLVGLKEVKADENENSGSEEVAPTDRHDEFMD